MGVTLTDSEVLAFLERGHTCAVTTLRADGFPVSLPMWFTLDGHDLHLQTPRRSAKLRRIRADSRACVLVEEGRTFRELRAVSLLGRIAVVEDEEEKLRAAAAHRAKYGSRRSTAQLPAATVRHYAAMVWLRFTPEQVISWDNGKLR